MGRARLVSWRDRQPFVVWLRYGLGYRWRDWRDFPEERRRNRK